jgi:glycosyltransferase involved in cell wall biosynthesis
MAPRVSVIIPAYNARAWLAETLDSVIAQTYDDWEAIVADDGSTDGTGDLAASYHPRVKCVRNERNLGIGGARNLALANASGELVALLDADDLWLPEYLQRQLARYDDAVASGEKVGIVCCGATRLGPEGPQESVHSQNPITLTALLRGNTIFVSAIVPRVLIDRLGGFATDCLGTEDYDLWLRILEAGHTVVVVDEFLAFYRVGDATVSANAAGMARAMQTTYRHALERGRLGVRQRAVARRELRWQRLIELRADATGRRARTGRLPVIAIARAAPLGARVMLERPELWLRGLGLVAVSLRGGPEAGARRFPTA